MWEWTSSFAVQAVLLVVGGAIAGFVNSLAGGGSFLTVPLLVGIGLPISVANGTNRVGVFVQCMTALLGFRQEGVRTLSTAVSVGPLLLVGSFMGAWMSSTIPDALFQQVFAVLMLVMLPVILLNPKPKPIEKPEDSPARIGSFFGARVLIEQSCYFALGLYGGAVQAGIGIPMVFVLAAVTRVDLVRANSIKVALVAALTAVALAQFIYADKVDWVLGLILAIGTGIGGYAGGRIGPRVGDRLIRPLMAIAVIGSALRLFWVA